MAKKTTTTTEAPTMEHVTIEVIKGNKVRMTAEQGWLLRSKNTGKTVQTTVSCHPAGWEVIADEKATSTVAE